VTDSDRYSTEFITAVKSFMIQAWGRLPIAEEGYSKMKIKRVISVFKVTWSKILARRKERKKRKTEGYKNIREVKRVM
jgi:hypothetical protein